MARICVDITKPDAGLLAPAQPLHPYAQPPQAVELKDELKMLVLSGDVDALDAKLAGYWKDTIVSTVRKGINAAQAAAHGAHAAMQSFELKNAVHRVEVARRKVELNKEKNNTVHEDDRELENALTNLERVKQKLETAKDASAPSDAHATSAEASAMAQALRELCLLGRADAGTAPRQLVGIEAEIEAYKQHAAHAQQMQAMAAAVYPGQALASPAVYPGQAPAVYPGQVLASPAVYPGQVLASPAVFQANPQWMRYVGC